MTESSHLKTFEPQSRDRLYFDQYQYSMRFRFDYSGSLRILDRKAVRISMHNHALWSRRTPLIQQELDHVLGMCDLIKSITVPYKRTVFNNWQYFYTNHTEFFDQLAAYPGVKYVSYNQAQLDRPRDVIVLEHSDYKLRSYFAERWYTPDQLQTLSKFILDRSTQFRITPNWRGRLPKKHCYITRSFFVDHNDPSDVLLLQMVLPGCVRKTLPIVSRT